MGDFQFFVLACMMYQRSLSNMRLPTYIGEVTCIDVDTGNLPPYIHGMRAVPTDMNDVLAMEMDIEYSGGMVLYVEARLEVPELDSQNGLVDPNPEASSVGEATTNLLEDFKNLRDDFKLFDGNYDSSERKDAEDLKHGELSCEFFKRICMKLPFIYHVLEPLIGSVH